MHTLFLIVSIIASVYSQTIVDIAASDPQLSTLVQLLQATGLDATLSGPGPFTVFAPTNDAFDAITAPNNTANLTNILTYHVLAAEVFSTALFSGLVADTVQTQSITIQLDGGVFVYDSRGMTSEVIQPDINATNGVIHIVNAVLLPGGTIVDIVANNPSLQSLATALTDADLIDTLQGPGPFTVFAPTDNAVAAFRAIISSEVLLYHVLGGKTLSDDLPEATITVPTLNSNGDTVNVTKNENGTVFVTDAGGRTAQVTIANIAGVNGVVHIIDIVLEFRSIVGIAQDTQELDDLVNALIAADLVDVLNGPGPFTVFAPTNEAFTNAGIPANISQADLQNVLTYHVLAGQVLSTDLSSGLVADTLQTESVTIQIDDGVFIYDSTGRTSEVTTADVLGTNGVIHIVDAVLLPGGTIVDIVSNNPSLTSLTAALIAANLTEILQTEGPFTVFAPTDNAVGLFGKVITSEVLLYHVLAGKFLSANISEGSTTLPTLNSNGDEVTIIKDENGVSIQDAVGKIATVTIANLAGTNGVVHIVDIVLEYRDIVGIAADEPSLSTLVGALTQAGLVSALQGPGPFTVFAPTNDAFDAITVPNDTTILANILSYHVLAAEVFSGDLSSGLVANTLINESITVQINSDGVFIYDSMGMISQVTEADVEGSNGVIHIIDAVLLPGGNIVDIVSNLPSLSSLAGALIANDLIETLQGDGPFTVFAPTNDAVDAFGGSIDAELLLYHVLSGKILSDDIPSGSTNLPTLNSNGDQVTVINDGNGISIQDVNGRSGEVTIANIAGVNGVVHIIDIVLDPSDEEQPSESDDDDDWLSMDSFWGGIGIGIAFGIILTVLIGYITLRFCCKGKGGSDENTVLLAKYNQ